MGRHRGVEFVPPDMLERALLRTPWERYVFWTGHVAPGQDGSLRSRALACIHEIGVPVSLRVMLQRAARLQDGLGLHPDLVRDALWQHQAARPATHLLLDRSPLGEFRAAADIPFPAGAPGSFRRGALVTDLSRRALQGEQR